MVIFQEGKKLRLSGAIRFRSRLLEMPGRSGWENEQFFCELSRANVEYLEKEFPEADWRCDALQRVKELRETEKTLVRGKNLETDYPFKTVPFHHQLESFVLSCRLEYYAYLMEMGTGKTKVVIDVGGFMWWEDMIDGMILIAPNGVHRQFVNEQLPMHMADVAMEDVETLIYQSGGNKAFQQQKAEFLRPSKKFRILAINVEALSVGSGVGYVQEFIKSMPGQKGSRRRVLIAVDESTRIKNHGSIRARNVVKLGSYCLYRRIMSGSPITRGIEDLFGQFAFLSPQILGFNSFYTFRNRYCIMKDGAPSGDGGTNYKVVVGYKNVDELQRKIAPWSYRVKKEECLDLPPKMYVKREVELSAQQRELYRQLRKEMLLELDGSMLTATMAAVRITKLQQILCGHVRFTSEGKLVILPDIPRMQVLKDLVEEAPGQVIIWSRFTPDIDRISEELKHWGVSRYDGKVSTEGREQALRDFRSGKNRVFNGQPASAGLGLNLVGPETVVYYSNSFDAEHRWQSEDRNHRAGTTKKVTYYDLVVPNSIDNYILSSLSKKKDIASMTIDEIREMITGEP